jgi:glycosyltransferase involved in cell wall biosynthesis
MRNIGLFYSETSDFRASSWTEHLNQMDKVLVANRQQKEACLVSGVRAPIEVVPCAFDMEKYARAYSQLTALQPYKQRGDFLFYTVGEMVRRKNLSALLKAFHLEFEVSEPVQLVIKSNVPGEGEQESKKHLEAFCTKIREGLKLHHTKPEILLPQRFTTEGMMRLHATCDCFVLPSYGEAWSLPAFDAMAMGKTPIVTACTGFLDYLSDSEGWMVPWQAEPVFGEKGFGDLFTGHETWCSVNIPELRRAMREAYENRDLRAKKAAAGKRRRYDFAYETVGPRLLRAMGV